ncbi:hypothetical protein Moror_12247 [Moniliophthora roreri MCA 2997]|uniref:Uncharacterized protein n=1 Tax=Moniliophthora roreri (strain MCA 2997) TaxID=1381753 RepID=V2XTU2_MONRO|nr:hypothetical protein Moror_12247 [Moniliophthora roreri MCA 2997]
MAFVIVPGRCRRRSLRWDVLLRRHRSAVSQVGRKGLRLGEHDGSAAELSSCFIRFTSIFYLLNVTPGLFVSPLVKALELLELQMARGGAGRGHQDVLETGHVGDIGYFSGYQGQMESGSTP